MVREAGPSAIAAPTIGPSPARDAGDRTQARAEVAQACVELAIDPTPHGENLAACEAWLRAHAE